MTQGSEHVWSLAHTYTYAHHVACMPVCPCSQGETLFKMVDRSLFELTRASRTLGTCLKCTEVGAHTTAA